MSASEFSTQSFLTAQSSPLPTIDRLESDQDDTRFSEFDIDTDNPTFRNNDHDNADDTQESDTASSYTLSSTSPLENEATRSNRFYGHRSIYHNWTRPEHKICQALDTERSKNLAAHLFNAHALKKRRQEGFVPNRKWTAWPMPANIVPREGEDESKDWDDLFTFRRGIDARPSARLEELLMARMLKEAKLRFSQREEDDCSDAEAGNAVQNEARTGENTRTRQVKEKDAGYSERPVVAADDQKSHFLLRPAARHVLSDLDNLLSALHHTRVAYLNLISIRSRADKRGYSSDAEQAPGHDIDDEPRNGGEEAGPKLHVGHARTTPREWSQVLGLASLSGSWSHDVIMRAANRCSSLFGEDMEFRTFGAGKLVRRDEELETTYEYTEDDGGKFDNSNARKPTHGKKRNKREAGLDDGLDVEEQRMRTLFCDVKGCARGVGGKGFSRKWNLHQHQKVAHMKT